MIFIWSGECENDEALARELQKEADKQSALAISKKYEESVDFYENPVVLNY